MGRRFDADKLVARGLKREREGDLAAAEALYDEVVERQPDHVGARTQLGGLLAQSGRLQAALPHLEAAARLLPREPSVLNNLGHIYRGLGQLEQARSVFEQLVALKVSASSLYGLGVTLQQLGELEAARTALKRACGEAGAFHLTHSALATVDELLGRPDRAIQGLTRILAENGALPRVRCRLGVLHLLHGNPIVGVAMLEGALQDDPDDAIAQHMLASARGTAPAQPDDRFVAELFDAFADGYDAHLRDVLETRVPELVGAVPELGGAVLDLGCGTGLAVRALGSRATRAVGVDLSNRMVQIARASGLYDEVHCASLESWLRANEQSFDTVLAADVLVYVGALEGLFGAIRPVCTGRFVFTIEAGEGGSYTLRDTGRYAHDPAYVESCALRAGFQIVSSEPARLRREKDGWVDGRVVVVS